MKCFFHRLIPYVPVPGEFRDQEKEETINGMKNTEELIPEFSPFRFVPLLRREKGEGTGNRSEESERERARGGNGNWRFLFSLLVSSIPLCSLTFHADDAVMKVKKTPSY